ncbi:MAG: hypothetical protein GXO77_08405 [Calditrichaeota bacterium]|nr:hypothetical protein [Calditrichota bacterium]
MLERIICNRFLNAWSKAALDVKHNFLKSAFVFSVLFFALTIHFAERLGRKVGFLHSR